MERLRFFLASSDELKDERKKYFSNAIRSYLDDKLKEL